MFFSEYIAGSSLHKAPKIYNSDTANSVNLGGCKIQIFLNGNNIASTTISLTGSIAPGDVYVVADVAIWEKGVSKSVRFSLVCVKFFILSPDVNNSFIFGRYAHSPVIPADE